MVKIKRENWNGKFNVVVRSDTGKILGRKRSGKGVSNASVRARFFRVVDGKVANSLREGVTRVKLSKVFEVSEPSKIARISRIRGANVAVSYKFKGVTYIAKSRRIFSRQEIPEATKQAEDFVRMQIAHAFGEKYDSNIGNKILMRQKNVRRSDGVVRYVDV